jgi:hypothetical protein
MKIGGIVGAVALAVVVAFKLGNSSVDSTAKDADVVEFRDDKAGWTISYPKGWSRLESKDTDVVLVLSEKSVEQNTGGSILARTVTLGAPVTDANLAAAKEVTDRVVAGDGIRHITEAKVVHQAGLPGYVYFYRFTDSASGREGVHSHYFLFKGPTMISVVFQALPAADFQRLANLYDGVIGSFRVL